MHTPFDDTSSSGSNFKLGVMIRLPQAVADQKSPGQIGLNVKYIRKLLDYAKQSPACSLKTT